MSDVSNRIVITEYPALPDLWSVAANASMPDDLIAMVGAVTGVVHAWRRDTYAVNVELGAAFRWADVGHNTINVVALALEWEPGDWELEHQRFGENRSAVRT